MWCQAKIFFVCPPLVLTDGKFSYNLDSIAMFDVQSQQKQQAQLQLVNMIMTSDFNVFNRVKGSIPVLNNQTLTVLTSAHNIQPSNYNKRLNNRNWCRAWRRAWRIPAMSDRRLAMYWQVISIIQNGDAKQAARQLACGTLRTTLMICFMWIVDSQEQT